jgi:hypothetical protein
MDACFDDLVSLAVSQGWRGLFCASCKRAALKFEAVLASTLMNKQHSSNVTK